jgi:hypothetical protein
MNFSITSNKEFTTNEMREAFSKVVQDEIAARAPDEGIKILHSDEPEQLIFNLTYLNKTGS